MNAERPRPIAVGDFRIGNRLATPGANEIDGVRIDAKAMNVLIALVEAAPVVLSPAALLERVWPNVVVVDNVVHQAVAQLRRVLGDDAHSPRFIETIPRRGYRVIASIESVASVRREVLPASSGSPADSREAYRASHDTKPALLAVLPFDNLSRDGDLSYLSDGIAEEILQAVIKTSSVRTIGRSSSFQFRGADKAARHVAQELHVTHVLDGALRCNGRRVRVSVQLIECAQETTVWSSRFDRELDDLFTLQDEIASEVATVLRAAFARPGQIGRVDPIAYDLYLRALGTTTHWLGARDVSLLEAAVELAPGFAAAWAELALSRAIIATDMSPSPTLLMSSAAVELTRARAREAADRALSLEPRAAFAHAALAQLEPVCGRFAAQQSHLECALRDAPNDATVLTRLERWSRTVGRIQDALAFVVRAYELDPLRPNVVNDYASLLNEVGRVAEANELFDRARRRWPELDYFAINPLYRAAYRGDWSRMEQLISRIRKLGPHSAVAERHIENARRMRDWTDADSARLLEELQRQISETGTLVLRIATNGCHMGLVDEVYPLLERASFAHLFEPGGRFLPLDYGLHWLFGEREGGLSRLQMDPRFPRLCARFGLCDYWVATDHWPDCAATLKPYYDFEASCRRLAGSTQRVG